MHSQEGEDLGVRLALAAKLQTMYVVAFNMKNQRESICVHSLNPEHLLAPRFKFEPPPQAGRPQQRMLLQVRRRGGRSVRGGSVCCGGGGCKILVYVMLGELGGGGAAHGATGEGVELGTSVCCMECLGSGVARRWAFWDGCNACCDR